MQTKTLKKVYKPSNNQNYPQKTNMKVYWEFETHQRPQRWNENEKTIKSS